MKGRCLILLSGSREPCKKQSVITIHDARAAMCLCFLPSLSRHTLTLLTQIHPHHSYRLLHVRVVWEGPQKQEKRSSRRAKVRKW